LKSDLNEIKSQLDNFPLKVWHSHTHRMNITSTVLSAVKSLGRPEFCSQAWAKMFEILCFYNVIPENVIDSAVELENKRFKGARVAFDSVHLCEAPGAFISALNHFIKISYPAIDVSVNNI